MLGLRRGSHSRVTTAAVQSNVVLRLELVTGQQKFAKGVLVASYGCRCDSGNVYGIVGTGYTYCRDCGTLSILFPYPSNSQILRVLGVEELSMVSGP